MNLKVERNPAEGLVRPAIDDWAMRGIFRLRDVRVADLALRLVL